MELLADRFAAMEGGGVVDLATGEPVLLRTACGGDRAEQARWAARCDTLWSLRQRSLAALIDYGAAGSAARFEAWRCGPRWAGSRAEEARVADRATAFLRACGLSATRIAPAAVHDSPEGPVCVPGNADGYQDDAGGREPEGDVEPVESLEACGLTLIERPAVRLVAELFQPGMPARPRAIAVWGPPGSGRSTFVLQAARMARLQGFVPVCSGCLAHERIFGALEGRSVLLIEDERSLVRSNWTRLSIRSPRPHVRLLVSAVAPPSIDAVAVDQIDAAVLEGALRPHVLHRSIARRVHEAAVRSGGLPGRLWDLLWPAPATAGSRVRPARRSGTVAAEQPAEYGPRPGIEALGAPAHSREVIWPAPAELAALRKQLDEARRLLDRGRRAPGERLFRQAVGRLARRGDWAKAVEGTLDLAASLLERGLAKGAIELLNGAEPWLRHVEDPDTLAAAAALAGSAWIDSARLDEAEHVLTGAPAGAREPGVPLLFARARCAFWAGRYAEGDRLMASLPASGVPDSVLVHARVIESRLAIGLDDLERGVGLAAEATTRARALGQPASVAAASVGEAFAHLAAGDLDAAERDSRAGLDAARLAHNPLCRMRARLLLAEAARRKGRAASVEKWLQQLQRLARAGVPRIVTARYDMVKDLATGAGSAGEIVASHVAATGLRALALFAPARDRPGARRSGPFGPALGELVEILRLCQNAEEETTLLAAICARLRRQIRAAGVVFVARGAGPPEAIASDGGRVGPDIAQRAMQAGIDLEPHRHEDQIEAAVPLRYGGEIIGAVAARWLIGGADDLSDAPAVLALTAAAAAPALAGAAAKRFRAPAADATELVGTSAAIAAVRQAIDRAARAPFAVLIEGESGSGKELVARAVHRLGPRRDRALCTMNCAALPDDLIEAELFGHARGAFTGAIAERTGVFEEAHGGTLFLDEIGELSMRAQAKVLRVLQEGELRRVGENVSRRVDVRVVAATNRNLRAEVDASRFRLDLFYRLDVIRIAMPPLRDRREDIALLAEHFWREAARRVGSRATLSAATVAALARYDWPGNVRELQNVLAALAVRSPRRGVVPPTALPAPFAGAAAVDSCRIDAARRAFEDRFVRAALVRAGGHRGRAASEMGLSRQGLTKLMGRLGISAEE